MSWRDFFRRELSDAELQACREAARAGVREAMIEMGMFKAAERVAPAPAPPEPAARPPQVFRMPDGRVLCVKCHHDVRQHVSGSCGGDIGLCPCKVVFAEPGRSSPEKWPMPPPGRRGPFHRSQALNGRI